MYTIVMQNLWRMNVLQENEWSLVKQTYKLQAIYVLHDIILRIIRCEYA